MSFWIKGTVLLGFVEKEDTAPFVSQVECLLEARFHFVGRLANVSARDGIQRTGG